MTSITREKFRISRLEMLESTNFSDLSATILPSLEDEDFYLDASDLTLSRNRASSGVKASVGLLSLRGALRDRIYVATGLMDATNSTSTLSVDSTKKATRFLAGGTSALISQARKLRKVSEIISIETSGETGIVGVKDEMDTTLRTSAIFGWKNIDGLSGALNFLGSQENSKKYIAAAASKAKKPARRFCGTCSRCSNVGGVSLTQCNFCGTYSCSKSCTADHKSGGRCTVTGTSSSKKG
jgi:hypothetical protein